MLIVLPIAAAFGGDQVTLSRPAHSAGKRLADDFAQSGRNHELAPSRSAHIAATRTAEQMVAIDCASSVPAPQWVSPDHASAEQSSRRCAASLHLFEREIEADILPYAKNAGLTVVCYGALCRGLLTGKISSETKFKGDDLRKLDPKFQGQRFMQYLAAVDEIQPPIAQVPRPMREAFNPDMPIAICSIFRLLTMTHDPRSRRLG